MEEENIHHANHGYLLHEARICSVFLSKMVELPRKAGAPVRASIIFFLILLICAFISLHWIDVVPVSFSSTTSFSRKIRQSIFFSSLIYCFFSIQP
ncbi:hypothetical protein CsSME_00023936 [Camellia sinensis var. sinensis]